MQTGRSSYWSMIDMPPSNVSIITSPVTSCLPQWIGGCRSVASNMHELTHRFKNSVLKRREGMLLLFMVTSSYPLPPSSTSILQPRSDYSKITHPLPLKYSLDPSSVVHRDHSRGKLYTPLFSTTSRVMPGCCTRCLRVSSVANCTFRLHHRSSK
jgi:hypothetical protein